MRRTDRKGTGNRPNIIIKKEEVVEGEGHGGAWKVAYADFVTAMMAFFLLMWLLNATTEDQRKGLADYFSPSNQLSHASSGSGEPFGGHTAFDEGALASDRGAVQAVDGNRPTPIDPSDPDAQPYAPAHVGADDDRDEGLYSQPTPPAPSAPLTAGANPGATALGAPSLGAPSLGAPGSAPMTSAAMEAQADLASSREASASRSTVAVAAVSAQSRAPTEAELRAAREAQEKAEFAQAAQQIRDAVRADPTLAELARQLVIDMTPEGLRIQILDEERLPMFLLGSAVPNDRAKLLLQKVTPVLQRLSQDISIAGHTDSTPFPGPDRTNWELSTERANATRRLLVDGGLPESRIRSVTGNADRDPLLPASPRAAANRRIAIVVLRAVRPVAAATTGGDSTGGNAGGNAAADNAAASPAGANTQAPKAGTARVSRAPVAGYGAAAPIGDAPAASTGSATAVPDGNATAVPAGNATAVPTGNATPVSTGNAAAIPAGNTTGASTSNTTAGTAAAGTTGNRSPVAVPGSRAANPASNAAGDPVAAPRPVAAPVR